MYFILSRIIVTGLSSKSVMHNSEVLLGKKKKKNGIKKRTNWWMRRRMMNGKRQSLCTIYIMLACVFLAVCKFGRRHYQAWYAIFSKETLLSIYNINSFINTSIYQISVYQHILHTFWYKQMLDLLGKYLENEIYKSAECNFSSSVYYGN